MVPVRIRQLNFNAAHESARSSRRGGCAQVAQREGEEMRKLCAKGEGNQCKSLVIRCWRGTCYRRCLTGLGRAGARQTENQNHYTSWR